MGRRAKRWCAEAREPRDVCMIDFACPRCAERMEAPDQLAGDVVACPICQQQVIVPTSHVVEDPAAAILAALPKPRSAESRRWSRSKILTVTLILWTAVCGLKIGWHTMNLNLDVSLLSEEYHRFGLHMPEGSRPGIPSDYELERSALANRDARTRTLYVWMGVALTLFIAAVATSNRR